MNKKKIGTIIKRFVELKDGQIIITPMRIEMRQQGYYMVSPFCYDLMTHMGLSPETTVIDFLTVETSCNMSHREAQGVCEALLSINPPMISCKAA